MDDGIGEIRKAFSEAEDVSPAEAGQTEGVCPPRDDDRLAAALREAARQPLNDFGNGRRFSIHFGEDAMFVPRVGWFSWTGKFWEKDPDQLNMRAKAQKLSDLILREIPLLELSERDRDLLAREGDIKARLREIEASASTDRSQDDDASMVKARAELAQIGRIKTRLAKKRDRHRSFAQTSGNSNRIDNALKEASVALAVPLEDLDAGPLDINTLGGLLRFSLCEGDDFSRTAEFAFTPHARDQRLTKIMPVEYSPEARSPLFDKFIARIQPDREMREFLQRWFGLAMTALTGDQKIAFFYGSGANGKSVLVDLMARLFGNYAATARIESLTGTNRRGGSEATPDLVPLIGARFVRTSEPDEGQRLQEGLIKELTGGETILVRALHSDFVEVRPQFKLTISGNHKPEIRGSDDGIWRRVMLVPFDVQIPEDERDQNLGDKLWEERAGILNWLIDGLIDYLERGLSPPEHVLSATQEYREESDPLGTFLTDCCVVTGRADDSVTSKDLCEAFNYYLLERGENQWKLGTISRQIKVRASRWKHPRSGASFAAHKASIMMYLGIRLDEAFGKRFRNAPRDGQGRIMGVGEEGLT